MANRTSAMLLAALIAAPAGLALAQTTPAPAPASSAPVVAPEAASADTTAPADNTTTPVVPQPAADAPAETAPAAAAPETSPATPVTAPAAPADAAAAPAAPAAAASTDAAATETAAKPDEEQPGSYYPKSTHGDWTLRCMRTADGNDPCELYQLLKDGQGVPVAEVSAIPFNGKAAALINFVAPLETDLGNGVGLQIDSGKSNSYPFAVCAPIGCISRIGLTADELAAMKKGNKVTVSLLPFGGAPDKNLVKLNMSLAGFTAGFDAAKAEGSVAEAPKP